MPRYKISVEYDGGPFVGWQRQDTGPSIQAALEDAIFAFTASACMSRAPAAPMPACMRAARSRISISPTKSPSKKCAARSTSISSRIPIVVPTVEIAAPDFHARFSATWRRYRYRILNRRTPAGLDRGQVWHVPVPLDDEAMADAAAVLVGKHDFNSFRSVACQSKTSIKTLDLLSVARNGEEIDIEVGARSFLHNQVRILVGTLQLVGRGQWTKRDVEQALAARDRTRAGPTAPPRRPLPDGSALSSRRPAE